jgi:hypothetical protein
MPLRSLAHPKREVSEKKWAEAQRWAGFRVTIKYKLPSKQRPDRTVAGSSKRLASRFYQLKTGHCLTGQHLSWTQSRPSAQCSWCPYRMQTWEHVFKNCPRWKIQRKVPWAKVRERPGGGRTGLQYGTSLPMTGAARLYWTCHFLSTTDVGRLDPSPAEEDAQNEASEWELWERREKEEERRQEAEEPGAEEEERPLPSPRLPSSYGPAEDE